MIQEYYRQMRKFGRNILAVVQQYDVLRNSEARGAIIGNSKVLFNLKSNSQGQASGSLLFIRIRRDQPRFSNSKTPVSAHPANEVRLSPLSRLPARIRLLLDLPRIAYTRGSGVREKAPPFLVNPTPFCVFRLTVKNHIGRYFKRLELSLLRSKPPFVHPLDSKVAEIIWLKNSAEGIRFFVKPPIPPSMALQPARRRRFSITRPILVT